jgi:hypothetical protein
VGKWCLSCLPHPAAHPVSHKPINPNLAVFPACNAQAPILVSPHPIRGNSPRPFQHPSINR